MDIRERAVKLREQGHSAQEVSERLSLSKRSVERYWSKYQAEGHCKPLRRGGYKRSKISAHDKQLKKWISQEPCLTLEQLRERFKKELKIKVSVHPIWYHLKKLGFSYKKNAVRQRAKSP